MLRAMRYSSFILLHNLSNMGMSKKKKIESFYPVVCTIFLSFAVNIKFVFKIK